MPAAKGRSHTIGVIFRGHDQQYGAARQKELISVAVQPANWITVPKNGHVFDLVSPESMTGCVLVVQWLFLAGRPRESLKQRRDTITQFVAEVRKHGGEIWEISSGQRTTSAKATKQMLIEAHRAVAKGPSRQAATQLGRPPQTWTRDQEKIIWSEWLSRDNATNDIAAAVASKRLKLTISANRMWHVVRDMRRRKGNPHATGASGRPWKARG